MTPNYDALFIGAHPDDIEIHAAGTIAKMTAGGSRVMISDMTQGEMGSRGTIEERKVEAENAAKVLGADRVNLKLPDGKLQTTYEQNVRAIVELIRETKPQAVFTHPQGDHHPDHNATWQAVRFACFQSGVLKYETGQERHMVSQLFYFVTSRKRWPKEPDFIVNTTDFHLKKIESLKCYSSQLANKNYNGPATYVSSDQAWRMIDVFAGFMGGLIGKEFGEGFTSETPMEIENPLNLPANGL